MSRYSDDKYSTVIRQYFGLEQSYSGAGEDAMFGTTDATKVTIVPRWYPGGPIKVMKFGGVVTSTTLKDGSTDIMNCRLVGRGASASAMANFNIIGLSSEATVSDIGDIASDVTITAAIVKAGEYISINSATRTTDAATAQITGSMEGGVAFWVDYIRQYDNTDAWDK